MSPGGDLALSLGGLRVPARARLFIRYFVRGLGFLRSWAFIETAQSLGERTQSLFGGALDRGFYRRSSRDFEQRVNLCPQEDFGGV